MTDKCGNCEDKNDNSKIFVAYEEVGMRRPPLPLTRPSLFHSLFSLHSLLELLVLATFWYFLVRN